MSLSSLVGGTVSSLVGSALNGSSSSNPTLLRYPRELENVNLHPALIQFQFFHRLDFMKGNFSDTIQLYMPEQASAPSTISWDFENFGIVGKSVAEALKNGTSAQDVQGTISGVLDRIKHQAIFNAGADVINKAGAITGDSNVSGKGLGGEIAGKVPNPYLTAVFRGVDFRKFNFTFKFTPLREQDCVTISNIIKTFRKHSLPHYADEGSFLNYPSECAIAYYWKGKQNKYLPKFKRAVCTGIDTDFSSAGTFATLRNGMPAHITINTSWSEVEIVTRQDVEDYGF